MYIYIYIYIKGGGALECREAEGPWHINTLELRAIWFSLLTYARGKMGICQDYDRQYNSLGMCKQTRFNS